MLYRERGCSYHAVFVSDVDVHVFGHVASRHLPTVCVCYTYADGDVAHGTNTRKGRTVADRQASTLDTPCQRSPLALLAKEPTLSSRACITSEVLCCERSVRCSISLGCSHSRHRFRGRPHMTLRVLLPGTLHIVLLAALTRNGSCHIHGSDLSYSSSWISCASNPCASNLFSSSVVEHRIWRRGCASTKALLL